MFITVQNLVGIAAVVVIIRNFEYFAHLARKCLFHAAFGVFSVKMRDNGHFCIFLPLGMQWSRFVIVWNKLLKNRFSLGMRAKFWVTKRLNTMWEWYFTRVPECPVLSDCYKFWHMGCYGLHEITLAKCYVNCFRGLGDLTPPNLHYSIGLAGHSYNSVSTPVLHCD